MPDAPNAPRIAVTIPRAAADDVRAELKAWGGLASTRILGEDTREIAFYAAFITSAVALHLGDGRSELERCVNKHGGRLGARDEWVVADRDLGDFLSRTATKPEPARVRATAFELPQIQKLFLLAACQVAEEDTERRMEARAITQRFDFGQSSAEWIFEATRNLGSLGFLAPYNRDGDAEDQFVHLTSSGVRKARELSASGLQVVARGFRSGPVPHSDGSFFSDGTGYSSGSEATPPDPSPPESIHSSSWTGIELPEVVEGERLVRLRSAILDIERQVEGLNLPSNSDRQQVMAIITAMKVLADAPEPPASVLRDLIALLDSISSIGAFALSLIAIMIAKS